MKVALELQPCLKEKSGIGIYTYELAKRLQENEEMSLLGNVFHVGNQTSVKQELQELKFNKQICPLMPYGLYKRIWEYMPIDYHTLFRQKPDITHFFNVIIPPRIEGKVINTIHDLTFYLYPETIGEKHLKFLQENIRRSAQRPDKIITISQSSKDGLIEKLEVDPAKIEIVYPGVDSSFFQNQLNHIDLQALRSKYQLPDQYILYMGTLEPRKNIERIVDAFACFKQNNTSISADYKLILVGKKGWLYEPIFEKVRGYGIEKEVIFTGYVEEQDKPYLYQMASLFMFPSLYEGFGMPVLEAMAAGVPVITSNTSSLPEVAGDAAILIDPYDIEGMAMAIEAVLCNEAMRQELIHRGYNQVKKFNWDDSAQKLYRIYKEIVD